MTDGTIDRSRLSGWTRLWVVFTGLSFAIGGLDVALSTEPFRWPLPLSEMTPQSLRQALWFLTPAIVATTWISIRWIWRGLRSKSGESPKRHMSTLEIARRTFILLVGGAAAAFVLALLILPLLTPLPSTSAEDSNSFWFEIFITFHMAFCMFALVEIWKWVADDLREQRGSDI